MTICRAVIQDGRIILDQPAPFPDGTKVKVRLEAETDDPLQFLIDHAVATGIPDLADEHDHHIYGSPKKKQ